MKRLSLLVATLILACAAANASEVGERFPDFILKSLSGREVSWENVSRKGRHREPVDDDLPAVSKRNADASTAAKQVCEPRSCRGWNLSGRESRHGRKVCATAEDHIPAAVEFDTDDVRKRTEEVRIPRPANNVHC